MSTAERLGPGTVADRIVEVRRAFDGSFARPVRPPPGEHADLLAIRAGGRPYALLLSQAAGLFPDRPVTALPGPLPALLGVAGFGATIVPVYDLAALLGHPAPDRPGWIIRAAGTPPLALAFHQLDGHVQVPATALVAASAGAGGCLSGLVTLPDGDRAIVDVPAARAVVHQLTGHRGPGEERQP